MAVQFISALRLKEMSSIHENVDDTLITPVILDCQDMYIQPIIGTSLYNELKDQITNDTVTVLNTTLLASYVIPCLISYVKYESVTELNFKFTNKNVSKKSSDNSEPLSTDDSIFLMNKLKDKAEWRAQRITHYLTEYSNSYPLYLNGGSGLDIIQPSLSNYTCGLVLDDTECGCDKQNCKCYIYR